MSSDVTDLDKLWNYCTVLPRYGNRAEEHSPRRMTEHFDLTTIYEVSNFLELYNTLTTKKDMPETC